MKLLNYTPHKVRLVREGQETLILEPMTPTPRVSMIEAGLSLDVADGIPLKFLRHGPVTQLPEPEKDTLLIVSAMVQEACPTRADLCYPTDLVRDANGDIIGAKSLARNLN